MPNRAPCAIDAVTLAMSGHTFESDRDQLAIEHNTFVMNRHPFVIAAVTLALQS